MLPRSRTCAAACGLLITLIVGTASGQEPRSDLDADKDAMITARLRHIEGVLSQDEHATRRWWRTWICVQSALLAGNVGWGLITFSDTGARAEHLLNAGGSLLGGLSLIVLQPPALRVADELAEVPDQTPTQRAIKLEAAETLLAESADAQVFGSGWAPYTGAVVVGTAIALPLWLKYDRKLGAAAALFGSVGLTAVQVATLPTASLKERAEPARTSNMPSFVPDADNTGRVPSHEGTHEETVETPEPNADRAMIARPRGLTLSLAPSPGGLTLSGRW